MVFFVGRNGRGRVSRVDGLGLASLNNFSVLWDIVVVSICPVPGPGVIWAG